MEVIGSSPTNPTIVKALNPEGIERFSYVMEKHLQYNTCSLVICLIHAGFYQPLWHYKVRSRYCQELCAKSVCRLRLNEVSQQ